MTRATSFPAADDNRNNPCPSGHADERLDEATGVQVFTCAFANADPQTATPTQIAITRKIQAGYEVERITGSLTVKEQKPKDNGTHVNGSPPPSQRGLAICPRR